LSAVASSRTQSGMTGLTEPPEENWLNGTNEGSPLGGPTEVGPPLGGPTKAGLPLGGPTDKTCLLWACNKGPPLRGPTKVGPPLGGPTDMTGSPTPTPHRGHHPIQPPCPIQTHIITTIHGPRLDGTNEGPPLGGPTEVGPLLGGLTEENSRPFLSAVALSPT
jgi:hypothetical protein